ncbi:MAG: SUF system NifU family Fe-S cluster assembly protein [Candidatus Obscuribacter sp.]|jgi:nitrogen fixation NifU-like protein|nr:SUF system NifU family Fe-S cluster assembly protein [Candidatus Obscuribacter sp.]MDQ5967652.1 nitrogen fixation protein NifU [Cyanobacteriota bacterium erpe_2018_sw_39hr_WHONDRS-SW48-000098_B_bin.30]MBK7839183.1 SUF system NifU family Fe-S cluster assembly protein [Candidatus Obscuribacter sp.]MBK9203211.1 SUF system NifU family Fe-S cluster assembly protein [Candidatus Obscuribacter sp.]MBK9619321.1 SUF system NifU family Fe-S cluster assembly protein [Candidatus Obscuribacter sp.]
MSLSDDLYRETILDHYHNPRNHGSIEGATEVEGTNPLCGDELTLYLKVNDAGLIEDIKMNAHGCSINTASGSMMSEAIMGQTVERAREIIDTFKTMMLTKEDTEAMEDDLEDLEALRGVKKYPVRIKCALLPWNTLLQGLDTVKK